MNKYLFFVFAFAVLVFDADAQTSSGNMMAGGALAFSSNSRQGGSLSDGSSFTFAPSFGYFVSENFAVGTSLLLSTSRVGTGSAKTISSIFGLGPFARYYKFTSSENFAFFGQAGLSFQSAKTDPAVGNVTHSNAVAFSLSPGAAYFFNDHWAVELSITGFVIRSTDPNTSNNDDKVTEVNFIFSSISPTVGLRYHF